MDSAYTEEDEAFRTELRTWLDNNLPDFLEAGEIADPQSSANLSRRMVRQKAWQRRMNEGGWAAINWPKDWGGREATIMQNVIYSEEMAKAKTPGIFNTNGIWQIGPMIIKWGTDEQKDLWLQSILNADTHWCQGFTEPEAGSDLANLRPMGLRDGDEYVLNGQKIFISTAHIAQWGLFLVRTDPDLISAGRKHEGITSLIVDMRAPGIDVRPI